MLRQVTARFIPGAFWSSWALLVLFPGSVTQHSDNSSKTPSECSSVGNCCCLGSLISTAIKARADPRASISRG